MEREKKGMGPYGFLVEFYQRFRHIVKFSLKRVFGDLVIGKLDVYRLNYGTIWVSKTPNAEFFYGCLGLQMLILSRSLGLFVC